MHPIDLVIPYVNCDDPNWQALYRQTLHRDFCSQRFRDYGTLLYQFRGIERHMPWIRRVYLIVQSQSQIPQWLNTKHEKLKVVFHQDIIPQEYLPVFKSTIIELHADRIDGLSENFILGNDDFIPIKDLSPEEYFVDDRPVQKREDNPGMPVSSSDNIMQFVVYRMAVLERCYLQDLSFCGLKHCHLYIPYNKTFWRQILERFKYSFGASFSESKYRGSLDLNHWLISDLQILNGLSVINDSLNTNGYIELKDDTDESSISPIIEQSKVICMNDRVEYNFEKLNLAKKYLNELLPDKSSFER